MPGIDDIPYLDNRVSTLENRGDLKGTTNQVSVTGGTNIVIGGDATLALPQDIAPESSPTFSNLDITNAIQFGLTPSVTMGEGMIAWDSTNGTVQIGMPGGNVNLQLGQEQHLRAKAAETILNGQVVRISGASGNRAEMSLVNNLEEIATDTIAVATEDIASGQNGYYTTFGLVNDINTNSLTEGAAVWLSSVDGGLTATEPTNPSLSIYIGVCIVKSATVGKLFVNIHPRELHRDRSINKEPTGFIDPQDVVVSYNSTTRKITLTGTVEAYWRGRRITELVSGWSSDAHNDTVGAWFLYYNGTTFVWSNTAWTFDKLQIALVNYMSSNKFALRECHGTEQWQTHEELHRVIGTYKLSGGDIGSYNLNSTTAGDRRPTISECIIKDEDLQTTNLTVTNDLYTQIYLVGAGGTVTWVVDASDIIPLSGNNPYYNQYTGGAWQQTLLSVNDHVCVWLAAIPVTSDATSQKYRFLWIQGQSVGTLASQQALTTANLTLTGFLSIYPEYVFIGKIILQYIGGNWELKQVDALAGTRYNQTATPGGYLSAVSTDSTITGTGIATSPLSIGQSVTTTAAPTFTGITNESALTVKEISTPANPSAGYVKFYAKTGDKLYKLNSAGAEVEIGAGTGGGASYGLQRNITADASISINTVSIGVVTINDGVTITVSAGITWQILSDYTPFDEQLLAIQIFS